MSQINESEKSDSLEEAIEAFLTLGDNAEPTEAYTIAYRRLEAFGSRAADVIAPMLLDSSLPEDTRERLTGPLIMLQSRTAKRLLLEAARSHPEEWARAAAVRALAFYHSHRLIAPMLALLEDPRNSSEIRSEAAHSLGMNSPSARGNAALVRRLTQHLNDPAPEVRLTVIFAITACEKRKHALNAIRRLVNDHSPAPFWNWTVAQEARWAVTDLQTDLRDETDPLDPVLLTDAWQDRIRLWKIQRRAKWWKRRRR